MTLLDFDFDLAPYDPEPWEDGPLDYAEAMANAGLCEPLDDDELAALSAELEDAEYRDFQEDALRSMGAIWLDDGTLAGWQLLLFAPEPTTEGEVEW